MEGLTSKVLRKRKFMMNLDLEILKIFGKCRKSRFATTFFLTSCSSVHFLSIWITLPRLSLQPFSYPSISLSVFDNPPNLTFSYLFTHFCHFLNASETFYPYNWRNNNIFQFYDTRFFETSFSIAWVNPTENRPADSANNVDNYSFFHGSSIVASWWMTQKNSDSNYWRFIPELGIEEKWAKTINWKIIAQSILILGRFHPPWQNIAPPPIAMSWVIAFWMNNFNE